MGQQPCTPYSETARGRRERRGRHNVDIELREGRLIVERARAHHYELDDLLAGIDTSNLHAETTTGTRVGRELW